MEKREFPVSLGTENSHWLKGDKSVINLTTADHDYDYVQATGSPSFCYEPHKEHNIWHRIIRVCMGFSQDIHGGLPYSIFLIPYVSCLLLVSLLYRFNFFESWFSYEEKTRIQKSHLNKNKQDFHLACSDVGSTL